MFRVHYRKLHWSYKNSASAKCLIFESALLSGGFRGQNKVDQTVCTVLNFLYVTGSMALYIIHMGGIQRCHCIFRILSVFCSALHAVCFIL